MCNCAAQEVETILRSHNETILMVTRSTRASMLCAGQIQNTHECKELGTWSDSKHTLVDVPATCT